MSDAPGGRRPPSLTRLTAITWIHPLFGVYWGVFRILVRPGRWVQKLMAFSICGNLLFVAVLVLGYYEEKTQERGSHPDDSLLVAAECVERPPGPLHFCQALRGSELGRIVPDAVYVASHGLVRARFEFTDEGLTALREVTLCDNLGRPWIDANLQDGSFIYTRYTDDVQTDPQVSLMDKDGDGIPDMLVEWELQLSFEPDQELTWRPVR